MARSATNVRTGRPKISRQPEISADTAMASASLPFLFLAVEVDGEAYCDARLHLIESEEEMRELSVSSKLNAEPAFLEHLHDIGWRASDHRLEAHFDDLGVRTTWRPAFVLEESLKPAHLAEDFERSHLE